VGSTAGRTGLVGVSKLTRRHKVDLMVPCCGMTWLLTLRPWPMSATGCPGDWRITGISAGLTYCQLSVYMISRDLRLFFMIVELVDVVLRSRSFCR
jgi:hypothetical protein